MATRRDVLKLALAGGGSTLGARRGVAQDQSHLTQYLCPPDDRARDLDNMPPSPQLREDEYYQQDLFVPPVVQPTPESALHPPPNPAAHQRYEEFLPQKFYEIHEREFLWKFHPTAKAYRNGSWVWGFESPGAKYLFPDRYYSPPGPTTPGPTYVAHYGEPVLVRRFNSLPTVGHANVRFALPSTTNHLHNGHTASESDGNPQDWIDSGEFWGLPSLSEAVWPLWR